MKKLKLTKGVQIILITLFVVIVGAIIVGALANDEAMAAIPTCSCGNKLKLAPNHRFNWSLLCLCNWYMSVKSNRGP